jgi:hypothetical protein
MEKVNIFKLTHSVHTGYNKQEITTYHIDKVKFIEDENLLIENNDPVIEYLPVEKIYLDQFTRDYLINSGYDIEGDVFYLCIDQKLKTLLELPHRQTISSLTYKVTKLESDISRMENHILYTDNKIFEFNRMPLWKKILHIIKKRKVNIF